MLVICFLYAASVRAVCGSNSFSALSATRVFGPHSKPMANRASPAKGHHLSIDEQAAIDRVMRSGGTGTDALRFINSQRVCAGVGIS